MTAELIEIEITESGCMVDAQMLNKVLTKLSVSGFRIAIDDFGIGYSSLNMLKEINVDAVKLDRGFLTDTMESYRGRTVAASILKLAGKLELITVAEGVEYREQADFLKENGGDIAQGYLFYRPMPREDFESLITSQQAEG